MQSQGYGRKFIRLMNSLILLTSFFLKKINNYDNEIYKIKGAFVEKVWSKSRYLAKQK